MKNYLLGLLSVALLAGAPIPQETIIEVQIPEAQYALMATNGGEVYNPKMDGYVYTGVSYQYRTADAELMIAETATSTAKKLYKDMQKFSDAEGDGLVSVARFKNTNPTNLGSILLGALTPKAHAAIARGNDDFATASATSVTLSFTANGSVLVAFTNNAKVQNGCTYNGTAMSLVGTANNGGAGGYHALSWVLENPTNDGSPHNIVCSITTSGLIALHAVAYSGAQAPSNVPDGHDEAIDGAATGNTGTSITSHITVTGTGSWVVAYGQNLSDMTSASGGGVLAAGQLTHDNTMDAAMFDSNGTVGTGSQTYSYSGAANAGNAFIGISLAPTAVAGAAVDSSYIILFE